MADLTQEEWTEKFEANDHALILDVRTEDEFEDGSIPNAINIDIYQGQEFISGLKQLDKSKSYFVYCRSGSRSAQACAIMNQLGFENAFNLEGGFLDWEGDTN